ncbi:hypothetical protein ACFVAQ_19600 [Streptomyces sp. NPDC057651]|uniref:hypothetical protein n=1 Tax=unclassified Streptomyces TaxID=2593676 RepID=UPI0036C1B127
MVEPELQERQAVGQVHGRGDASARGLQALEGLSVDGGQEGVAVDDGCVDPGQVPAGEQPAELGAEVTEQGLSGLELLGLLLDVLVDPAALGLE